MYPHDDIIKIAKFIHRIYNGLSLEVYGDGNQTRNFTYISDEVKVTLNSYSNQKAIGEMFNIASENEVSVNAIISLIETGMA